MTAKKDRHVNPGVFIRLPKDMITRLQEEADARMVSKTWLASRLVLEGLNRLKPADAPWVTEDPQPKPVYRNGEER
jgi:hypothetical protein